MLPPLRLNILSLIVLAACSFSSAGGRVADIDRSGRSIQLDGFLIDWNQKNRHLWNGSKTWYWDAVNTPEGVAGYFHNPAVKCSLWTYYAEVRNLASRPWQMRVSDPATVKNGFFCSNRIKKDSLQVITFEWIIPWDSVAVDSTGSYTMHLAGNSVCGDTLQPFLLTGRVSSCKNRSSLPPRFAERLILIAVLLSFFVILQIKIRKKTRRREWPRR